MSNTVKVFAVLGDINPETHVPAIKSVADQTWEQIQSQYGEVFPTAEVASPPVNDEKQAAEVIAQLEHTSELSFIKGIAATEGLTASGKGSKLTVTEVPVERVAHLITLRRGNFAEWLGGVVTQADLVNEEGLLRPKGERGEHFRTVLPQNVRKLLPTQAILNPKPKKEKETGDAKPDGAEGGEQQAA